MSETQASFNPLFDAPPPSAASAPPPAEVDPAEIEQMREILQSRQSLGRAIAGGFLSALIGAGAWAVITVVTGHQHEAMSLGIGLLVGLAVRKYGRGISPQFGVAGASLAFFGSLLGNVFSAGAVMAQALGQPLIQFEMQLITNPAFFGRLVLPFFSLWNPMFYVFAAIAGYYLSYRAPTNAELTRMILAPDEEEKLDV